MNLMLVRNDRDMATNYERLSVDVVHHLSICRGIPRFVIPAHTLELALEQLTSALPEVAELFTYRQFLGALFQLEVSGSGLRVRLYSRFCLMQEYTDTPHAVIREFHWRGSWHNQPKSSDVHAFCRSTVALIQGITL